MASWQVRVALVTVVLVLGLFQGTRTALGRVPPESVAYVAPIAVPVREHDPIRGHFFRPPGSDAVRPPLSLRPVAWWPERTMPVALR
jgi:hypothetical protein